MNIDTLENLARAATPGPWFSDQQGRIWRRHPAELYENGGSVAGDKPMATTSRGWFHEGSIGFPAETNASFIAAANPAAILELISEYREMKFAIEKATCWLSNGNPSTRMEDSIKLLETTAVKINGESNE